MTYEDLDKVPYAAAVIYEGMRMWPPVTPSVGLVSRCTRLAAINAQLTYHLCGAILTLKTGSGQVCNCVPSQVGVSFAEDAYEADLTVFVPATQQRTVNETTTVGKWTLPRGTWLYINLLAMHRNPKYFPEPEVRLASSSPLCRPGDESSGTSVCPVLPHHRPQGCCSTSLPAERSSLLAGHCRRSSARSDSWRAPRRRRRGTRTRTSPSASARASASATNSPWRRCVTIRNPVAGYSMYSLFVVETASLTAYITAYGEHSACKACNVLCLTHSLLLRITKASCFSQPTPHLCSCVGGHRAGAALQGAHLQAGPRAAPCSGRARAAVGHHAGAQGRRHILHPCSVHKIIGVQR